MATGQRCAVEVFRSVTDHRVNHADAIAKTNGVNVNSGR